MTKTRVRLLVRGRVQGVGFRPFAYRLARSLDLNGFVTNTPGGVTIEYEGTAEAVGSSLRAIRDNAPPSFFD